MESIYFCPIFKRNEISQKSVGPTVRIALTHADRQDDVTITAAAFRQGTHVKTQAWFLPSVSLCQIVLRLSCIRVMSHNTLEIH
jgi:hypothetical protein